MAKIAKRLKIVEKIKKLVEKTGSTFLQKRRKTYHVSEATAKSIQKKDYDLRTKKQSNVVTPPYLLLADQLEVKDDQIFRASVFSLAKIAVNEKTSAPEIIVILEKHADSSTRTEDQRNYIISKIELIKRTHKLEIV